MNEKIVIPNERIINKIVLLRGEKIILDVHLAELFDVETRTLKQSVRRNIDRFPDDFMFLLISVHMCVNSARICVHDLELFVPRRKRGGILLFAVTNKCTFLSMISLYFSITVKA